MRRHLRDTHPGRVPRGQPSAGTSTSTRLAIWGSRRDK
jgi:hypothetical protein